MTDIMFGQSYYLRFDPKLYAAMQPYPPLGTLYAAAYMRQRGYDVALFDAMLAESENEWAAALDRYRPQFAVLFEDNFNYLSKMCLLRMREAAFKMIDMAKARDCTVILCGADATDHAAMYFDRGAEFVLLGEGEETLGVLIDRLSGKTDVPFENIVGLATRTTQHATRRPDITQLDQLPFPAWDLVDIDRYKKIWRERHGYYSMNMVTTRGCPYHCNWCAKPIWGQRYNSRSPENVAAEMKWLKETYQPDHIWFADDIFGLKPNWIEKFGELVKEQGASIPFKCLLRADLVKPSVVEGLRRAGCQWVWMGAESGSQKILDAMDKGTTVPQIYEARRLLGEAGINVAFFLQFGYPGETRVEVERTLQMVRETMPDDIGISVSYPLPGTKFYERVKSQLGEKQNWLDSDDLAMLYRGPFPQSFYRILHRVVHAEFRMRKARRQLSRKDSILSGAQRSRRMRMLMSIPYHWLQWQVNRLRLNRIERSSPSPNSKGLRDPSSLMLDTQRAFDSAAAEYDGPQGNNALIQRMREQLWRAVEKNVPNGSCLLDIGCGTGLDAIHFAEQGYHVVATDWSPRMIDRTHARALESGMSDRAIAKPIGIQELDRLNDQFDAAYSDLGPLNCAIDLESAARSMARLLKPNGKLIVSVIGRACPWEFIYYALHGDLKRARLRNAREIVPVSLNGEKVWTHYYSPREFYRAFQDQFELNEYRGLSIFLPPPYLYRDRFRSIYRPPSWMDDRVGGWPLIRNIGDHFLMILTKR